MCDDVVFARDTHERYVLGQRFVRDDHGGSVCSDVASHPFQFAREVNQLVNVRIVFVKFSKILALLKRVLDGDLRIVWHHFAHFGDTV